MTVNHQMTLVSDRDDGIWLDCTCGYILGLGSKITVREAINAQTDHQFAVTFPTR